MKTIKYILILIGILHTSGYAIEADFQYSYWDLFEADAETYLVGQTNIQRVREDVFQYYSPVDVGTLASLTYRFDLGATITEAWLIANLASLDYGNNTFGFGSLWGSTDGNSWQLLLNAPTQSGTSSFYNYSDSLPPSLLGYNEIWFQARLQASGLSETAQFSRNNTRFNNVIFSFDANVVPEPSTSVLLLLGAIGSGWLLLRRQNRLTKRCSERLGAVTVRAEHETAPAPSRR